MFRSTRSYPIRHPSLRLAGEVAAVLEEAEAVKALPRAALVLVRALPLAEAVVPRLPLRLRLEAAVVRPALRVGVAAAGVVVEEAAVRPVEVGPEAAVAPQRARQPVRRRRPRSCPTT